MLFLTKIESLQGLWYNFSMTQTYISKQSEGLTLKEAIRLQEIESNPLDKSQIAMFEMFEREGWNIDKRVDYLNQKYS